MCLAHNEKSTKCYWINIMGFPSGESGEESTCNAGDVRSIPGSRKIPWRGKWQPALVSTSGTSPGQRSLAGYSPWGHKRVGHNFATKRQHQKLWRNVHRPPEGAKFPWNHPWFCSKGFICGEMPNIFPFLHYITHRHLWDAPSKTWDSRPKKVSRDGNRDISGLTDKGSYVSEAGPGATPQCVVNSRQHRAAIFPSRRKGRLPVIGTIDLRVGSSVARETRRGACSSPSLW